MISILKMKAFGDFEVPYEIDVAAGDHDRVHKISEVLNNYCKTLPGCAQDVKLAMYLDNRDYADKLAHQFIGRGIFSTQQAIDFVEGLKHLCEGHYVYVYEDVFTVNNVVQV